MARYREILLHAGLSKTGSTSIQDNCREHRALLARHGINYPVFRAGDHVFRNHSIPLTVSISDAPSRYGLALQRRFGDRAALMKRQCRQQLDELVLAGAKNGVLLLSTELLESWRDDDLQSLRAYLLPHTHRLRVLAYLRSPESTLASLLQERAKAGATIDPASIVGRTKAKVLRLRRNFPAELELINYHQAREHATGLVGSFMALAGVPGSAIRSLVFRHSNPSVSAEAYRLLERINRDFPPGKHAEHGVHRHSHDLDLLVGLPGQPFQLPEFQGSALQRQVLAESRWLESELGWQFPSLQIATPAPAWQPRTIARLERILAAIGNVRMRRSIADLLLEESGLLASAGRPEADRLRQLAVQIKESSVDLCEND